MFSVLDFIDSKDIRDYNQHTLFTPIEQAYLIYHSLGTTVEEKMSVWRELLDTYNEKDFEQTRFGKVLFDSERSNRQILVDMIAVYEFTLALQNCTDGVVFEAKHHGNPQRVYFPDYRSAYAYLKEQKKDHDGLLEDYKERFGERSNVAIMAEIVVRSYGKNDWYSDVFHFDHDLRLVHLWPNRELFVSDWGTLRYLVVYVPTPFKKGDIVRLITSDMHKYGVLAETPDEEYCALQSKEPFPEALHDVRIDCFEADDSHGHFNFHHCKILELEKCSEKELPKDQKILGFLSSVYKGQSQIGDFLYSYPEMYALLAHEKALEMERNGGQLDPNAAYTNEVTLDKLVEDTKADDFMKERNFLDEYAKANQQVKISIDIQITADEKITMEHRVDTSAEDAAAAAEFERLMRVVDNFIEDIKEDAEIRAEKAEKEKIEELFITAQDEADEALERINHKNMLEAGQTAPTA